MEALQKDRLHQGHSVQRQYRHPQLPDIPDQYEYTYSCYTHDMVEKVA